MNIRFFIIDSVAYLDANKLLDRNPANPILFPGFLTAKQKEKKNEKELDGQQNIIHDNEIHEPGFINYSYSLSPFVLRINLCHGRVAFNHTPGQRK